MGRAMVMIIAVWGGGGVRDCKSERRQCHFFTYLYKESYFSYF